MEDVHDIYRDGVEENTLIWVDSAQKDGDGDGEYVVKLIEPIKNVVSVRVIEATLPATVMSVDKFNRHIEACVLSWSDMPPSLAFPDASLVLEVFLMRPEPTRLAIYDPEHDSEHKTSLETADVMFVDSLESIKPPSADGDVVLCIYTGKLDTFDGPYAYDVSTNTTVVLCSRDDDEFGSSVGNVELIRASYALPVGRYDGLRDFLQEMNHAYSESGIKTAPLTFIQSLTCKPERSNHVKIDPYGMWSCMGGTSIRNPSHPNAWCAVDVNASSARNVLGFQSNTLTSIHGTLFATSSRDTRKRSCVIADSHVDFTAERYVWLRCPEIEHHMCTGVGKVLQRGIGVFRLDLPGNFKEESTEYISTIPPKFHPIARLSQLTFRFDTGSSKDERYNFGGIKHFMLLSVVSLTRDRREIYKCLPRMLNPSYDTSSINVKKEEGDGDGETNLTETEEREVIRIHNSILVKMRHQG